MSKSILYNNFPKPGFMNKERKSRAESIKQKEEYNE